MTATEPRVQRGIARSNWISIGSRRPQNTNESEKYHALFMCIAHRYTKQYYPDGNVWCYMIGGRRCDHCGSNVHSHVYDTKDKHLYCQCNGCGKFIYEVKPEYVEEYMKEGVWK